MPASVCDPVSNALRLSLSSEHTSAGDVLDNRLIASAKTVLLTNIDFEESGNYQSNLLEGLKSKYVVIRAKKPLQESKIFKGDGSDAQSASGSKEECKLPTPQRVLFPYEAVSFGWTGNDFQVGSGMVNVGNTCYLNSTLQALFHVPAFANWLMSDTQHTNKCNHSEGCIVCSMRSTLVATQRSNGPIKPWHVYSKLRLICRHLTPGRQEDAHEFLRYLIEAMEKSFVSRYGNAVLQMDQYSKETTPLNQILGGYLRSAVCCLACGHVSTTFQHFQDLLLDIRKAATMEDALDTFFSRERLEDLGYKCEACNKKVSATKQFFLERAPAVLCIALKRFTLGSGKLSRHISYRPQLTLNKYIFHKNRTINLCYRLVALVTHLGPSQNCGHYTAIARASSGLFYQFDDSCVRSLPVPSVLATNAYIMFYEMDKASQPSIGNNSVMRETAITSNEQTSRPAVYGPKLPDDHFINRQIPSSKLETGSRNIGKPSISFNQNYNNTKPSETQLVLKNGNSSHVFNGNTSNGDKMKKTQNNFEKNANTPLHNSVSRIEDNPPNNGKHRDHQLKSPTQVVRNSKMDNQPHSHETNYEWDKRRDRESPQAKLNGNKHTSESEPVAGPSVTAEKSTVLSSNEKLNSNPQLKRDSKSPCSKSSSRSASSLSDSRSISEHSLHDPNSTNSSRLVPYEAETSEEDDEMTLKSAKKTSLCTPKDHVNSAGPTHWIVSVDTTSKLHLVNQNIQKRYNGESNQGKVAVRSLPTLMPAETASDIIVGGHNTLGHLQQMSHRGYGAPVMTWNGTRANLSKEMIDEKRFERKRTLNGIDDIDSGRIKKPCTYNKYQNFNRNRNGYNPFQDKQNRQHNNGYWAKETNTFNGNNQDRRPYCHQYRRNNGHNQFGYRHKHHNYPRHR